MHYFKILSFIIALFQSPITWSMGTGDVFGGDDSVLAACKKRQSVSGSDEDVTIDTVTALKLSGTVDDTERTLVVSTPSKRRMLCIGDGSYAQVYITTKEMVARGLLTVMIPSTVMALEDFSVLREIVSRGLLKVEIPSPRGPFLESAALQIILKERYLSAAKMYDRGLRGNVNKGAAFYYFEAAARKGSSRGMFGAALMLDMGDGVPVNKARAADLYAFAMRRGHPVAPYNLGLMLLNNEVGESYPGETIQFTIFLAEKGVPQAQEILCRMGIPW